MLQTPNSIMLNVCLEWTAGKFAEYRLLNDSYLCIDIPCSFPKIYLHLFTYHTGLVCLQAY